MSYSADQNQPAPVPEVGLSLFPMYILGDSKSKVFQRICRIEPVPMFVDTECSCSVFDY